jgi:hypothetical protein
MTRFCVRGEKEGDMKEHFNLPLNTRSTQSYAIVPAVELVVQEDLPPVRTDGFHSPSVMSAGEPDAIQQERNKRG